jgi:hypothetical protein
MLVIDPCKVDGKFCFIAPKRGTRIGWKSPEGEVQFKRWFKHASGSICWEEADQETPCSAHTEETLYDLMPFGESMPKAAFIALAVKAGMSQNRAKSLLSKLIFDGRLAEDGLRRSGTNHQRVIRRSDTQPLADAIVDKSPQKPTKLVRGQGMKVNFSNIGEGGEVVTSVLLEELKG